MPVLNLFLSLYNVWMLKDFLLHGGCHVIISIFSILFVPDLGLTKQHGGFNIVFFCSRMPLRQCVCGCLYVIMQDFEYIHVLYMSPALYECGRVPSTTL